MDVPLGVQYSVVIEIEIGFMSEPTEDSKENIRLFAQDLADELKEGYTDVSYRIVARTINHY